MKWILKQYQKLSSRIMKELRSLRRIWCWVFLAVFLFMTFFMLFLNYAVHATIITVWGGVVTAIFTGYVISSTTERIKTKQVKSSEKIEIERIQNSGMEDEE